MTMAVHAGGHGSTFALRMNQGTARYCCAINRTSTSSCSTQPSTHNQAQRMTTHSACEQLWRYASLLHLPG